MKALAAIAGACLAAALLIAGPGEAQQARAIDYVNATSGNVANATATATLATSGNRQQFFTGFEITYGGASAASCVTATLTGLVGGTENFTICAPAGVGAMGVPVIVQQTTPLPANFNTAISLTLPALGFGNTAATVNLHGYILQQ